jgi:hypothetical protein
LVREVPPLRESPGRFQSLNGLMSPRGRAAFFRVSRSQFSEIFGVDFSFGGEPIKNRWRAAYCWHFG